MQKMFISWKRADLNFIKATEPASNVIIIERKIENSLTWNDVENSN